MSGCRPWVVKVGGALCERPSSRALLARRLAEHKGPLVVVHGGGARASAVQRAMGGEARFVGGRRITSTADLDAVEMALCGTVNKALVRDLIAAGRRAVGLSGCDAGLVSCDLVPGLGLVGRPVAVRPAILSLLLRQAFTPVVAPVSLGPSGEAVNVNADEVACALAAALRSPRLLLLSDVEGLLLDGRPRAGVDSSEVDRLVRGGQVSGGMEPKLKSAAAAATRGVGDVRIAGFDGGPLRSIRGTRVRARKEVACA